MSLPVRFSRNEAHPEVAEAAPEPYLTADSWPMYCPPRAGSFKFLGELERSGNLSCLTK